MILFQQKSVLYALANGILHCLLLVVVSKGAILLVVGIGEILLTFIGVL